MADELTGVVGMDDLLTWLRGVLDEEHRRYQEQILDWQEPEGWDGGDHVDDLHHLRWHGADIKAKRVILDRAEDVARLAATKPGYDTVLRLRVAIAKTLAPELERVVWLLAFAYQDRPGFRQEWAP